MPLNKDETTALLVLIGEKFETWIKPFRDEVMGRFDEVASKLDGLYQRDEKREQEYLFISERVRQIESKIA